MSEHYLFLVASDLAPDDERRAALEHYLSEVGEHAPALSGAWLLALDADEADAADLNAAVLIEALIDRVGESCRLTIVEIDNIVTYNIEPDGEALLDGLIPVLDYEGHEEEQ